MTFAKRSEFPALRHIILLIPWLVVGLAARAPLRDNSFLWHVRAGTIQIESGEALVADPFSFNAPGIVWRTQSWLADIGYGFLERIFGLGFVWPLLVVANTLVLVSLALIFRRNSKSLTWLAAFLTVSTLLLAPFMNPRPALISMVILSLVVLAALESRLWWTLPLLSWVWATIHGGWPIGVLFVLLWAILQRDWRLGQHVVPMSAVALFTAHGWGTLEIILDFLRAREALALITEWAPTNLASLPGFVLLLGIVLAVLAQRHTTLKSGRLLIFLVPFLYLSVSSTRSLPLGWLALSPLITLIAAGREDPSLMRENRPGRRIINLAIGLGLIVTPFLLANTPGLDPARFPIEAATMLRGERLFHDDITGGYLIYAFGPERQVLIDDRAELFGDRMAEFVKARNAAPLWEESFARFGIDEALVRVEDPIGEALTRAGWDEIYRDEEFLLLRPADA